MTIAITGFSAKHKRRVRDIIAENTNLRVTNKLLWMQELAFGTSNCAVLKKRTLFSYPEISVEQGMRELDLVRDQEIFVIYVRTENRSAGAIILNEQAKINKDIINLVVSEKSFEGEGENGKDYIKKALIGIWNA